MSSKILIVRYLGVVSYVSNQQMVRSISDISESDLIQFNTVVLYYRTDYREKLQFQIFFLVFEESICTCCIIDLTTNI